MKMTFFPLLYLLGTPDYMAPEIWGGNKYYGAPVDMW